MTAVHGTAAHPFEHEALVYDSDGEYVEALAPRMVAAVDARAAVVAVVTDRNAGLLWSALGERAAKVNWIGAAGWYEQPVRTVAAYDALLRQLEPGVPAFVVGEVQFGGTEDDWRAWTEYEAALNRALERHTARVICPYDTRALPAPVVADARRTHPYLVDGGHRRPSTDFVDPEALVPTQPAASLLPGDPPDVDLRLERSVREGRLAFADAARSAGLPRPRVDELTLGLSEVLANAVLHGGGTASLRIWAGAGSELVCAVEDAGPGSDDWMLGYGPPPPGAESGYGLWLARRVFDRSTITRASSGGMLVVLAARR